jgi:hypothetical protein
LAFFSWLAITAALLSASICDSQAHYFSVFFELVPRMHSLIIHLPGQNFETPSTFLPSVEVVMGYIYMLFSLVFSKHESKKHVVSAMSP